MRSRAKISDGSRWSSTIVELQPLTHASDRLGLQRKNLQQSAKDIYESHAEAIAAATFGAHFGLLHFESDLFSLFGAGGVALAFK